MSELLSGLLGSILGCTITLLGLRFDYRKLFAETVSANRMDWINVWRENISKFLACAEVLSKQHDRHCREKAPKRWFFRRKQACKTNDEVIRIQKEMYEARAMILGRLNLDEPLHCAMLAAVNQLNPALKGQTNFAKWRDEILSLERKILKPEWERVKMEAKGKNYGKS